MITAISSLNSNKVSFAANPTRVGEKLAGKAADSFEKAVRKGLTPNSSLRYANDNKASTYGYALSAGTMLYITTHHS